MPTPTTAPGLTSRRGTERLAARQAPAAGTATSAPKAVTAADQQKLSAIQADARKRVMAAFTMAKTLLPQSETAIQAKFAAALIEAPTHLVSAAFKQLAVLATRAKQAETFEDLSGTCLNKFIDEPSLLEKLKTEVLGELKADPKTASVKKKAAPGDEGDVPAEEPIPDALPGDAATDAPAEMPTTEPPPADPAVQGDLGDAGEAIPANDVVPDSGADAGLMSQIEQVEADVSQLETAVSEIEGQALDLATVFDPSIQADKATGLADEGADIPAENGDDFFGPSGHDEMEEGMDFGAPETGNPQDFFSGGHNTASLQVDAFLGGKYAAADVDVPLGDMADHFATELPGDKRNAEADHDGDMLSEVLDSLSQEGMTQERDVAPEMETPAPVQASANRTAAEARARVQAGPQAPKRSAVNPGQPGISRQASAGQLSVTASEIDQMLFRDRV